MSEEKIVELQSYGSLNLKTPFPTLAQLEEFCAEARKLGLGDNAPVNSYRQGLMGPVVGWYVQVPVAPMAPVTSAE